MKFWDGPWIVITKISMVHYKIQRTPRGKFHIVHGDRLKGHYGVIVDAATKRLWLSLQPTADRIDRLACLTLVMAPWQSHQTDLYYTVNE